MKQEQWKPGKRAEEEFARVLRQAWLKFGQPAAEEIKGFPALMISSAEFLLRYARQAAVRMVTGLYFEGAKTWREAARASGRTDVIYRALSQEMSGPVGTRVHELIRQNAELISSFPTSVARRVASAAAAHQRAGGRASELQGRIIGVVRSRAQLIARTEISKASTALTQARSEELGLDWYVWQTSQDQRVRLSHRKMHGVLVNFSKPPSPEALLGLPHALQPYNAGNVYNCRCYPEPVVRLEHLRWPHKVFYAGRIQYMTLSNFKLLTQNRRIAA